MMRAMRCLLQKVKNASVSVDGSVIGSIDRGYLLFLGVLEGDTEQEALQLAEKIVKLRLFGGPDGTINDQSLLESGGEVLVVSQFTLAGRTEKGNRPDYTQAARPDVAKPLYERFVSHCRSLGIKKVETGQFGAKMEVSLVNDGPVTLFLEKVKI